MKFLYLDAVTDMIVVGIYEFVEASLQDLYTYKGVHPRESSYRFVKDIELALESTKIEKPDAIVANKGPGSFTGIRICVSTARNLAQLWDIPAIGFDCLEVYSYYYFSKYSSPSLVILDGKQKKVFSGMYTVNGYKGTFDTPLQEIDQFFDIDEETKIYTDFEYEMESNKVRDDIPDSRSLLEMYKDTIMNLNTDTHSYEQLLPNYLRGTYADKYTQKIL